MGITMDLIKTLREKSGAGMVDCKNALEESRDDINKAVEILRKKGITKAANRSERETREGLILVSVNQEKNEGYILEVNSETDFVARNEQFKGFAEMVLRIIESLKPENLENLMNAKISDYSAGLAGDTPLKTAETVKDRLDNLSGTIGEKLAVKRFEILPGGSVASYSHAGGRIGVLAALDKPEQNDLAYEIAMQVAASNPKCIYPEQVPVEELNKEKEIYIEQLKKEGKPENMVEKIIQGKLNKYFDEICLARQEYIKDDKKRVQDVLGATKVESFIRYSL